MAVPYTFASATSAIPLSQLDTNFATAITLGNTSVYLGNTTATIGNLTLTNATISSVSTPITPVQGGTGLVTIAVNGVMIGNGTGSITTVAPGASGNVLTSNGTSWVSGAGSAAVANSTIYINSTTINTSYTIASGTNGFTVGPVTINSGNSINVSSGQRWVIL